MSVQFRKHRGMSPGDVFRETRVFRETMLYSMTLV